jgi:hypothetical protein
VRSGQLRVCVTHLLDIGHAIKKDSPWAQPAFLVPKRDGTVRMVFDSRRLNSVTVPSKYPNKKISAILEEIALAKPTIFSIADIRSAFNNIELTPEAQLKAAVITGDDLFVPTRMMFGLINGPATWNKAMSRVFQDLKKLPGGCSFVNWYADDIIIYSKTMDEHLEHLKLVLKALCDAGLKIQMSKLSLFQPLFEPANLILEQWADMDIQKQKLKMTNLYYIHKDLLYKKRDVKDPMDETGRICVPENLWGALLAYYHINGHIGYKALARQIKASYYVPRIYLYARQFTSSCHLCAICKASREGSTTICPETLRQSPRGFAWCVDILEGYPSTDGESKILVCMEYYTHFKMIFPLKNATGEEVRDIIENNIIKTFGPFKVLISDGGSNLTKNKDVKEMLKFHDITTHTSVAYSPISHGSIERSVQECSSLLRILITQTDIPWNKLLCLVQINLNTMPLTALGGLTSMYCMTGVEIDMLKNEVQEKNIHDKHSITKFWQEQKDLYHEVVGVYNKSYQAARLRKGGKEISYPVGSFVYIKDRYKHAKVKKWPKFVRTPLLVFKEYPNVVLLKTFRGIIVLSHKNNVKRCFERVGILFSKLPFLVKETLGDEFTYEQFQEKANKNELPNFYEEKPVIYNPHKTRSLTDEETESEIIKDLFFKFFYYACCCWACKKDTPAPVAEEVPMLPTTTTATVVKPKAKRKRKKRSVTSSATSEATSPEATTSEPTSLSEGPTTSGTSEASTPPPWKRTSKGKGSKKTRRRRSTSKGHSPLRHKTRSASSRRSRSGSTKKTPKTNTNDRQPGVTETEAIYPAIAIPVLPAANAPPTLLPETPPPAFLPEDPPQGTVTTPVGRQRAYQPRKPVSTRETRSTVKNVNSVTSSRRRGVSWDRNIPETEEYDYPPRYQENYQDEVGPGFVDDYSGTSRTCSSEEEELDSFRVPPYRQ